MAFGLLGFKSLPWRTFQRSDASSPQPEYMGTSSSNVMRQQHYLRNGEHRLYREVEKVLAELPEPNRDKKRTFTPSKGASMEHLASSKPTNTMTIMTLMTLFYRKASRNSIKNIYNKHGIVYFIGLQGV